MAVSAKWYANGLKLAFAKGVDWVNDNIKVMLVTSTYVPDQNAHVYKDVSITGEASGTNYTAGGQLLAGKTLTEATLVVALGANATTWANASITARYAVIYDDSPASNKPLLGYVDLGVDTTATNGAFTLTWNASGILTVTAS